MAESPETKLEFTGGKPDPGRRKARLPAPLPEVGDDFDWQIGDYESYRDFMLSELQARFLERQRWTAADMETVLIDILAAAMDQLSDMADRTVAESFLGTARHPERVYKWLQFIGYNLPDKEEDPAGYNEKIRSWREKPHIMEQDRSAGPATICKQKRMASLGDYDWLFDQHPLVLQAKSCIKWGGSWPIVVVTVHLWNNHNLFDRNIQWTDKRKELTEDFHKEHGLLSPTWSPYESFYDILIHLQERFRMAGQEVLLRDAVFAGIDIELCVDIGKNYFRSEVRKEVERVLSRGPGGFFEPNRLKLGQDLYVSDFYERLMGLDGVDNITLTEFKRSGDAYPNLAMEGVIKLEENEIAVCDNDSQKPELGILMVHMNGGRRG